MRRHVPMPHRNLMLLSVGAAYAAQRGAGHVAISLNAEDVGTYSSTSRAFLRAMEGTLQVLACVAVRWVGSGGLP